MKLLELEAHCPECGGTVVWVEQQIIGSCEYCSSILYFEPDTEHRFYLEPHIKTAEEVKNVLVLWNAEQKRAEVMGRYPSDEESSGAPRMLSVMDVQLAPFLTEFAARISVRQASMIYVPYWHFQATLIQNLLAVSDRGIKEYCFRRAVVDQALPAYDQEQWNFRDRGLRFKNARFKEVTREVLASKPHLAFLVDQEAISDRIVHAYPPVEPAADYLFKHYSLCAHRKIPVLRPYWIVNYTCDAAYSVIVDGCFGTVAGHPDPEETAKLFHYNGRPHAPAATPALKVISSRCPICGADTNWRAAEKIHFCMNCGRALVLRSGEIQVQSYEILPISGGAGASPADAGNAKTDLQARRTHHLELIWLPFWRFHLALKYRNQEYRNLGEYFRLLFAERLLKQRTFGDSVSIPAFSIKRAKRGDQLLAEFIASASTHNVDSIAGPAQPYTEIQSGRIDATAATEMLSAALPTASGVVPTLFKSANLVQILKETTLNFAAPELIVIPYSKLGENLIVNSKPFPAALLDEE